MDKINLLLDSNRGRFIPRDFVKGFDLTKFEGISEWARQTCVNPDADGYWEAWDSILLSARHTDESGRVFTLHQDGDLWLLCLAEFTADERENFGFSD